MRAYIIQVKVGHCKPKISQEGYESLEEAQSFIEHRTDNPVQRSPFWYRSEDGTTDYRISEVRIIKGGLKNV